MKLYEIDAAILACIDTETGEITDFERLEELNIERDKKLENVALYVKQLQAEAEALNAEEKKLKARRQAKEKRAAGYAEWLSRAIGKEFETARVRLSFIKSEAVEIADAFAVVEYLEKNNKDGALKYSLPTISKAEVKKLIEAGEVIPGAEVVERQNLQIN